MLKRQSEKQLNEAKKCKTNEIEKIDIMNPFIIFWTTQHNMRDLIRKLIAPSDEAMIRICCKTLNGMKRNYTKAIQTIKDSSKYGYFKRIQWMSINKDRKDMLYFIHDFGSIPFSEDDEIAQKELIQKYVSKKTNIIYKISLKRNNLPLMKWAKTNGYSTENLTIDNFVPTDDLETVKWGYQLKGISSYKTYSPVAMVGSMGNLEILKFLLEKHYPWDINAATYAAGNGHLHILTWAKDNNLALGNSVCCSASNQGHLEILRWSLENGLPNDRWTILNGINSGSIEILECCRLYGLEWDPMFCTFAAKKGKLDILKWAVKNKCPWKLDNNTLLEAIEDGYNIEIIQFMAEIGAPLGTILYVRAVKHNRLDILNWLIQIKCPYNWHLGKALKNCHNNDIVLWGRQNKII